MKKTTLKPAKIPDLPGNTKPKKAFKLILNAFKQLLQNKLKKNYLTKF